ncbi:MAG: helix-hairpin-helix domain-containing protein [Planctomycetota bacterium]|nr:helix-hairpin-helix domain-containing protein [Planctomycetota bacterium]
MISRVSGMIESVDGGCVSLRVGPLCLAVMVPACDIARWTLQVGHDATFFTSFTLDGQTHGTSLEPRLLGFTSEVDRQLFRDFTSVNGIGPKRALRAFSLPPTRIAEAIAAGDAATLRTLPEVGRKLADSIILELRERIAKRIGPGAASPLRAATTSRVKGITIVDPAHEEAASAAVSVLMQIGESRAAANDLVERALGTAAEPPTADSLVTSALRLRGA